MITLTVVIKVNKIKKLILLTTKIIKVKIEVHLQIVIILIIQIIVMVVEFKETKIAEAKKQLT